MTQIDSRRRTSLVVPIVLIALGGMFLYANWRPAFDPWPILKTYWPLILIFVGLGKMWDARQRRQNPDGTRAGVSLGATFGALAFVLVLIILFWHGRAFTRERRYSGDLQHQSRTVDRQGAKSVNVSLETSAGEFNISGGSSHLLDADFKYSGSYETPRVEYNVSDGVGHLSISQDDTSTHFGTTHNDWNLRFSNDVPLELGRDGRRARAFTIARFAGDAAGYEHGRRAGGPRSHRRSEIRSR